MKYKLQRDGNFVAYCGSVLDYTTYTGQGHLGDYFLAIDDSCILHLFEGTADCNSISVEQELWTNIRLEPLKNGDRLGKGEMVRFDGNTLVLQSSDGNLVLYHGQGSDDVVLWAANQEWDGPPASNFQDYYSKVTQDGYLQLVGKDFQYGQETVYFHKKLNALNGNSDVFDGCFTVEYDVVEDDLEARPCNDDDGTARRLLRGTKNS